MIARKGIALPKDEPRRPAILLSLSLIPFAADADLSIVDNSTNSVLIANTAKLLAGVASSSVVQILPKQIGGGEVTLAGQSMVLGQLLSPEQLTAINAPASADYHFAPLGHRDDYA